MIVAEEVHAEETQFEEHFQASSTLFQFFSDVIWGTEEVRYRVPSWEVLLRDLPGARYLVLEKNGEPLAARLLLRKQLGFGHAALEGYYHSLFSVRADQTGRGYGRQLAKATVRRLTQRLTEGGLIYAYVEAANHRSEEISTRMGYEALGKFDAMTFNRISPRPLPSLEKLPPNERASMVGRLQHFYRGHALIDFQQSLHAHQYWVLRENGEVVAGAQVKPQCWEIQSLGGLSGAFAMRVLPRIPILGARFDLRAIEFLKVGNLYVAPGREKLLNIFLEGLLSVHGLKTSMMYLDPTSPVTVRMRKFVSFGFLNALAQTPVNIFGYSHRLTRAVMEDLKHRPKVISPLDI